jgi:hypothetical protein
MLGPPRAYPLGLGGGKQIGRNSIVHEIERARAIMCESGCPNVQAGVSQLWQLCGFVSPNPTTEHLI